MRTDTWPESFDAYTCFGYEPDVEEISFLNRSYRSLKPGEKLIIVHINHDRKLNKLQDSIVHELGTDYMININQLEMRVGEIKFELSS